MNEIKINVPEGMEIDRENSTFECIKFKPKWIPKRGDIAVAGSQIILVNNYIKSCNIIGFDVMSLAILDTHGLTIWEDEHLLWVEREASASEKELFINKLNEQGYIYDPNDTRVVYKKEKELPKTWEEFRKNNPIKPNEYFVSTSSSITRGLFLRVSEKRVEDIDDNLLPSREYAEAMLALCKLIQLRDCYNDGWKPTVGTRYTIEIWNNRVYTSITDFVNHVLSFKTRELRDTFLQNFRDLIEQAKLLL